MQSQKSWSKFYIYLSFIAMIAAALGLVYLALSHLPRQKYILHSMFREQAYQILQKRARLMENQIATISSRVLSALQPTNLTTFTTVAASHELVSSAFLLNERFHIVFPQVYSHYRAWQDPVVEPDYEQAAFELWEAGQRQEFAEPPQYQQAVKFYTLALKNFTIPAYEIRVQLALAWCYYKMEQYDLAMQNSLWAIDKTQRHAVNPQLELTACYYYSRAMIALSPAKGRKFLLQLYDKMVHREYILPRRSAYWHWESKLRQLLLADCSIMTTEQRQYLDNLIHTANYNNDQEMVYQVLKSRGIEQIQSATAKKTGACYLEVNGNVYILSYRIHRQQDVPKWVVGFCSRAISWKKFLQPVFTATSEVAISLYSPHGILAGPAVVAASPVTVAVTLNKWPWCKLIASPTGSSLLETNIRRDIVFTIAITLLIAIILFIGVYMVGQNFYREVELSRMKSDFVDCISHELRTPLALLQSYSETLYLGRVAANKKSHYYQVIMRETGRLTRLVQNILNISKVEAGKFHLACEATSLPELLSSLVAESEFYWPQYRGQFILQVERDIAPTVVDPLAIRSAVFNLVDNAVKYSIGAQEIIIGLSKKDRELCLYVKDHGRGIAREEQKKIFAKFYRVSAARRIRGTGLGLTLVEYIAKAHNGRIVVDSTLNQGSCFQILIPWRECHESQNTSGGR